MASAAPLQASVCLPRVPGPKLVSFTPDGYADIKFLQRLSEHNAKDGYVWKVEIHGSVYALKIFNFTNWRWLNGWPGEDLNSHLARKQFYYDYFDPFSCECRAYGRLKEEDREEDLAVRAHGFLFLTPEQEAEVTKLVVPEVDWPDSDSDSEEPIIFPRGASDHSSHPVRAIVKEYVGGPEAEQSQIPQMWEDLKELHGLGIAVRDIHMANYMGGKLVDFSRAWTMYHPCLDEGRLRRGARDLAFLRGKDWSDLEDMIDAVFGYDLEIRPMELHECAAGDRESGTAPELYDWRGRYGEEAVAHVEGELFGERTGDSSGDEK